MISVLLAEDDALYRQMLRTMIPWQKEGFAFCHEAANGLDALQKMKDAPPQLLITDISMPGMNGVALIRQVKQKYPQTLILVLSAYDAFEYVKDALKNGAEDYFLKTDLNNHYDGFLEVLRSLRAKIENADDRGPQIDRRLQINSLLWYVVGGMCTDPLEAQRSISQAFLFSYFSRYVPIAFCLRGYGRTVAGAPCILDPAQTDAFENTLYTLEESSAGRTQRSLCALLDTGLGICLLNMTGVFSRKESSAMQQELLARMRAKCSDVMMAVGPECMGIAKAKESFEALFALLREHVPTSGQVEKTPPIAADAYRALQPAQNVIDQESLCFAWMQKNVDSAWKTANTQALMLLSQQMNHVFSERHLGSLPNPEMLAHSLSQDAFLAAYQPVLKQIAQRIHAIGNPAVRKIVRYIQAHYAEDLSVSGLAALQNLNPNYLSNVFKQELGIRLIEFLNRTRLDDAMSQMRNTDEPINAIAVRCGFQNVSYFYSVFKKSTGMSVKEYRKSIGKEDTGC